MAWVLIIVIIITITEPQGGFWDSVKHTSVVVLGGHFHEIYPFSFHQGVSAK